MAAFAMLSLQSPSRLAFDKQRAEGNVGTIYGMEHVPCDPYMRERLDPVAPEALRPAFQSVFRQRQRGKVREALGFLEGHSVVALDGTGSFSSPTMHCASCRHKVHRNGSITSDPQRLGAAMIPPDVRAVLPLMPEPMITQDGTANNDGERHAAKRFLATLRQDHPPLKCIVTEDSLRANAPPIETLHDHGLHSILGVKAGDHASLFTQVRAAEHAGRGTDDARHDRAAGVVHRFRFVNAVPLQASRADVRVNVMEYGEMGKDKGQSFNWVTDVRVSQRNGYQLMRGGRARWKRANETCKTLKNQGDNCEPNDGHGAQHLSVVLATMLLRAFLVDHTQQLCCAFCRAVWAKMGSKRLWWERRRALFYGYHLESMRALLAALFDGHEKHRPLLSTDTSSCPPVFLTSLGVDPAIPNRHRCRLPRSRTASVCTPPWRLFCSPFHRRQGNMDD
jgi:hypothetical protein